jgi:hypothetical protein
MPVAVTERRFVLWDDDLRRAFDRLCARQGLSAAARTLHMPESNLRDYVRGLSRAGSGRGAHVPRKFLSVGVLERLAAALDDPGIENREALTQREWSDRGEWRYLRG